MSDFNEMNIGPQWYIAHTYTGYENKVKMNLEKIIENRGLQDLIFDVRVPVETIIESDGTKEREVESKIYPSYVFIKMVMTDTTWHVVRNITGVTGFVGPGSKPVAMTEAEVKATLHEEHSVVSNLAINDEVDIIEGPFVGFSGKLSEISSDGNEVTVIVSSIGNDMPINIDIKSVRRSQTK